MADSKITALTALTAADPTVDMFPVVDVSDTTMAASGTTKRISINNILACSPSATLASATITGDLTVATNKLKVDTANSRVGVNTTTFATDSAFAVKTTSGKFDVRAYGGASVKISSDAAMGYNVATGNGHIFQIADADAMTLNSTGLGVGVTPTAGRGAVQLSAGVGFPATQVASSDANTLDDYEEGTFTPTVIGSTSAGVGVYTTQIGYYTKIGNLVTVRVALNWTAHTGTGVMRFGGLPFTVNSPTSATSAVTFGYVNNVSLTAGNILTAFAFDASTFVECWQTPVGGGAASTVPIDSSAIVIYTTSYSV